jgi:predicted phosphoribosyltransferase
MDSLFLDRADAGRHLAERLRRYARRKDADVIVLGLPRGGVIVASEVARALNLPLDVLVVRKLGVPDQPELAMGAIADGGTRVLHPDVLMEWQIPPEVIEEVTARELAELERRKLAYRGHRPPIDVRGRIVFLVDDGLATGMTMRAAVRSVQKQQPAHIVVAAPVASRDACLALEDEGENVSCVCLCMPEPFFGVGAWYEDFSQTTDEAVIFSLTQHR